MPIYHDPWGMPIIWDPSHPGTPKPGYQGPSTQPSAGISDLWKGFLEEHPESAYYAYQGQQRTPNQKKYFQDQFADVQNKYKGQLGQQIMGGGTPNLTFTDFLSQYFAPQGGAEQEWGSMTPRQRGFDYGRFAPATRWIV